MKIALVYDRVNKWGGAERILLALKKIWPDAPLYTGVYNPSTAQWAGDFKVYPSFVQKIPFAKSHHEWFPYIMTLGFETMDFSEYDIVVSVASAEAKGIITRPETLHICYCLTPTRYLWSHKDLYLASRGKIFKTVTASVFSYLGRWDKIAAQRPDYYLSISKHVKNRIKKYYKRESEVIYPPVNIFGKTQKAQSSGCDYYLCVSRLVPYKRVDLAIKTCNKLKLPLVIVGAGVEEKKLRRMAGETVRFVSGLTDRELLSYYQDCRALIAPQEEDFGLSIAEAQAAGKPVIAYRKGGAEEIVKEGQTGEFFDKQSVEALTEVLVKFDEKKYNAENCRRNAERFGEERFEKEFKRFIEDKYEKHKKWLNC